MSARGFVTTAANALKQGKVTPEERAILRRALLASDPDTAELLLLIENGYVYEAAEKAKAMAWRAVE